MNLTQIQGQWGAVFSNGKLLTILYVKDHANSFVVRALQKCVSKSGQLNSLMTCFMLTSVECHCFSCHTKCVNLVGSG